jgi:hypothetical protein
VRVRELAEGSPAHETDDLGLAHRLPRVAPQLGKLVSDRPAASIQLSRLVQAYVAEPGPSLEEKATRVGVRRNELLRAARGTISRTTRLRLLVFFAAAGARPGRDPSTPAGERAHCQRKRGFT